MIVEIEGQLVASSCEFYLADNGDLVIKQGNVTVSFSSQDVRQIALIDKDRPFDPRFKPRGRDDVNELAAYNLEIG